MSQIRTLIPICLWLGLGLGGVFASAVALADEPMKSARACFEITSRLARLACYDKALGRHPEPGDLGGVTAFAEHDVVSPAFDPMLEAQEYLAGSLMLAGDVGLTLLDRLTGSPLNAQHIDDLMGDEGALLELQKTADLVTSIAADASLGTAAVLLVACRSGITEMELHWPHQIEGRQANISLQAGDAPPKTAVMRIIRNGHVLQSARGLEAIHLIRSIAGAARVQIAPAEMGQSAFFDLSQLRPALVYQARICFWSGF